jgi:RNA polymerase sigma factor (sigma-70 family)
MVACAASPTAHLRVISWATIERLHLVCEFFGRRLARHHLGCGTRAMAWMTKSDEQDRRLSALMQAAQSGDGWAYALLLTELTPLLRRSVHRRLTFLQPQDVEDLVQDILLSLHAVRATYDPRRPFLPWLFGIVHHRVADHAKRYARHGAHEVAIDTCPVTFADEATKTAEGTYRDPEALAHAIQALPPGQRETIEMLKLREMSLKEAAATSGTSIGALKVAAHRAIHALRRALSAEAG